MDKWKNFFQSYRVIDAQNDNDLLYQVGTTVKGKPISSEQHIAIINSIKSGLSLNSLDSIIDLCCGNGVITFDLSEHVASVLGIDASLPYINNAKKLKSKSNIFYINDDIINLKNHCANNKYNKALIYSSLAYFSTAEFSEILHHLKNLSVEKIFIGSILDTSKKFEFFNTFKRKLHYLFNYVILRNDLGLGRWWSRNEITQIAKKAGYEVDFVSQNSILHTAHYRFDVILKLKVLASK